MRGAKARTWHGEGVAGDGAVFHASACPCPCCCLRCLQLPGQLRLAVPAHLSAF